MSGSTWIDIATSLTHDRIARLTRPDLPPGFGFEGYTVAFEDIAEDSAGAAAIDARGTWEAGGVSLDEANTRAQQVTELLAAIEAFEISPDGNPNEIRNNLIASIGDQRNWLILKVRPHRPAGDADVSTEVARIRSQMKEIEQARDEALAALGTIRTRSADTGAVSAADVYLETAKEERRLARWSAGVLAGAVVVFLTGAVVLFFGWGKPDADLTTGDAVAAVAGRTLILAVLAYLVTFSSRDYRAHRHLVAVSNFKANALKATPLLVEGFSGDDNRQAVVSELVRAVFAVPDSGYVDNKADSMMIQTPAAALLGSPPRPQQ